MEEPDQLTGDGNNFHSEGPQLDDLSPSTKDVSDLTDEKVKNADAFSTLGTSQTPSSENAQEKCLEAVVQCDSQVDDNNGCCDPNFKENEIELEENKIEDSMRVDSNPNAVPDILYSFQKISEVGSYSHPLKKYFIGCKWSPDGTCLLSNSADYTLRLFDLPQEFHSIQKLNKNNKKVSDLKPSLEVKEGGLVYDYAWYPFMSSWNPPTCCFVATSAGSPIHLWDAYTGKIRASYRAYDFADEVHTALSLAFSTSGEDIYCGFRNFVKIFDISKPGRECDVFNLKEISGQKGIVSCISENPAVPDLFAVGTYSKTLALYTRSHEFVCMLNGQRSGLTQLMFSDDGTKLFSGARMDNEIICWDIRNLGKVLLSLERIVTTNQRIYFDLTRNNKFLISGGTDGKVRIWDIQEESHSRSESDYAFNASEDCINGVSMHNTLPLIATASGQQSRVTITDDEDDQYTFYETRRNMDTSLKLWWAGISAADTEIDEPMHIDVEPT